MAQSGVYGSVRQPKSSKPEVPCSTPGSSYFSLVLIKNLINDKSKHKKKSITICIVLSAGQCSGPLAVIYNMYKSMTS